MGGYRLLDHTADVIVQATGDDFVEALSWVATAMFSVIADLDAVQTHQIIEVIVKSDDRETLVVDWLNELLFRFEAEGFLPKEFQVSVNESGTEINARCAGEPADPDRHRVWPGVKAATYHDLEVVHDGEWRILVVLDL